MAVTVLTREVVKEVFYKQVDQFVRSRFASKAVPEFHQIHVHAERARPIDSCVGEVLETKPRIRMSQWGDPEPNGRDDLHRTAEILSAKFVLGKKSGPGPDVERH